MINLLPAEKIVELSDEYRRRRRLVAGALVFVWLGMAALVIFSGYVSVRAKRQAVETALAAKRAELAGGTATGELSRLMSEIAVLSASNRSRVMPTDYFKLILAARPEGARLKSVFFTVGTSEAGATIQLSGQSRTRRDLLEFLDRLRANQAFASVESPVSNLIKETEVPFNIALSLKTL